MTTVTVEVVLPAESQTVAGVFEHRAKLVEAAAELGQPHTTDTVLRLPGGVRVAEALQRAQPVGVALHWQTDSGRDAIHRVLAAIRREFDVEYMTVDGTLIAADHPEILAARPDLSEALR